jgi:hypothetical protein
MYRANTVKSGRIQISTRSLMPQIISLKSFKQLVLIFGLQQFFISFSSFIYETSGGKYTVK